MTHQVHVSSLSAQAKWPYPPGYGFPAPFGRRPSLLGPSCPRCGVKPPFRRSSGLLDLRPDPNGIAAFRTSEIRSGWVLPVLRGLGVLARDGSRSRVIAGVVKLLLFDPSSPSRPSVAATFFDEASSEVNLRSPVRPSPRPARLDGSGSPWASPLCCRTLRYLALAGVRDWPGHWLEHDHESRSLKLVRHRVATPPSEPYVKLSLHTAQASDNALLIPRRSRDTHLPGGKCPTAQGRGQHADQPCDQSCTLLRQGHFLACAASARLAWGGRTSKGITPC